MERKKTTRNFTSPVPPPPMTVHAEMPVRESRYHLEAGEGARASFLQPGARGALPLFSQLSPALTLWPGSDELSLL